MNIIYIIGNGFDLNLDLNTSYESFIEYYCDNGTKENKDNYIIDEFKNDIRKNKNKWKDAELALGRSTSNFLNKDNPSNAFYECYNSIVECLSIYLKKEQERYLNTNIDEESFLCFCDSLGNYLLGLKPVQLDYVNSILRKIPEGINYYILNLNYTQIIDQLFEMYNSIDNHENLLGVREFQGGKYYNKWVRYLHLHGNISDNMIFAVGEESQIESINIFENDSLLKNMFIKKDLDHIIGYKTYDNVDKYLSTCNIIYLYGVSLGPSDITLWKSVIEALVNNSTSLLIVYWFELTDSKIKNAKLPYLEEKTILKVKDMIIQYSNYDDEINKTIMNRIFIIDNDIFSSFAFKMKERMNGKNVSN